MHNGDLGYYQYELLLKALPAPPEKPVHFQTVLGSSQSILAKFTNYTRLKTEYYCKVSGLQGEREGCRKSERTAGLAALPWSEVCV